MLVHSRLRTALLLAPLMLLLATFALPPLQRAQEARVLETARSMVAGGGGGGGWRAWMVPHVNGRVRLQKPPLAYWASAASFKAFGVSVWSGRLPMALAAALTVVVTYLLGRWLVDDMAATIASITLCGCLLLNRLGLRAETDVIAALFATAAVYALWRGWTLHQTPPADARGGSDFRWHHLAAASIAMAMLAKGPPAFFPILFLFGLLVARGGWRVIWRFCATGAILTLAVLALPWFIYIANVPESKTLGSELSVVVGGGGHANPPWYYLPHVFLQTSPWQGFLVLAVVAAATAGRRDPRVQGLFIWLLAILVPLSCIGQKQEHYLMYALPPLTLLIGWAVARATSGADPPLLRAFNWVVVGMLIIVCAVIPAPIVAGIVLRGHMTWLDVALTVVLAALAAGGWWAHAKRGATTSIPVACAAGAIIMTLVISVWGSALGETTYDELAADLHAKFGDRPYAFYENENLSLVFHMRRQIGEVTEEEVDEAMAREPRLVILVVGADDKTRRRLSSLQRVLSLEIDKRQIDVYERPAAQG